MNANNNVMNDIARQWLQQIVWYLYTTAPEKKENGASLGSKVPRPKELDTTVKLRDILYLDPRLSASWDNSLHPPAMFVHLTPMAIVRLDSARECCDHIADFLRQAPNCTAHISVIYSNVPSSRAVDNTINIRQLLNFDGRFSYHQDHTVSLITTRMMEPVATEQPIEMFIAKWLNDIYAYLVNKPGRSEQGAQLGSKVPRPPQIPNTIKLREVIEQDPRLAIIVDPAAPANTMIYLAGDPQPALISSQQPVTTIANNAVITSDDDAGQLWLDKIVHYLQRNPIEYLLGSQVGLQVPKPKPTSVKLKDLVFSDPRLKCSYDESKIPPTLLVALNNDNPSLLWLNRIVAYLQGTSSGMELFRVVLTKFPRPATLGNNVSFGDVLNSDPKQRLQLVKNTSTTPPTYWLRLAEKKVAVQSSTISSTSTALPVRDDHAAASQWRNAVATFLESEFRKAASLSAALAAVPLPESLRLSSPVSLLSEAPQRFELQLHPRTNEMYVGLRDSPPEVIKAVKPVDEVVDDGEPEDTTEPFPQPEATWETPLALRTVEVNTATSAPYMVMAPLELKNKDYVRRILDIVSDGISICVQKIMNKPKPTLDIYYQLKDIIEYPGNFSMELRCSSIHSAQWKFLETQAKVLRNTRNGLMHMSLGGDNSASRNVIKELFRTAFRLLAAFDRYAQRIGGIKAPAYAKATLINLRKQYLWHMDWNTARKNVDVSQRTASRDNIFDAPNPEIDLLCFGDEDDSNIAPSPMRTDDHDLLGIDAAEALTLFFEPDNAQILELRDEQVRRNRELYLPAILNKTGTFFEDDNLTITYSIELLDGAHCKIVLKYTNITLSVLKSFQVSVHDSAQIGSIQLGPYENNLVVEMEQFVIIELMSPEFPGPDLQVEYVDHVGTVHRGEVKLPMTVCLFNSPVSMPNGEYTSEWDSIGEETEVYHCFHCRCPSDEMTFVGSQLLSFVEALQFDSVMQNDGSLISIRGAANLYFSSTSSGCLVKIILETRNATEVAVTLSVRSKVLQVAEAILATIADMLMFAPNPIEIEDNHSNEPFYCYNDTE